MFTAPFPGLASEPEAMSWAEIDPTKVLGRRRGQWRPCRARNDESFRDYRQCKMVVRGSGGRCAVCASSVEGGGR